MNTTQAESIVWSPLNLHTLNNPDFVHRSHASKDCIPAVPHVNCVTMGKSLYLSLFLYLYKKDYHSSILTSCHENEMSELAGHREHTNSRNLYNDDNIASPMPGTGPYVLHNHICVCMSCVSCVEAREYPLVSSSSSPSFKTGIIDCLPLCTL